MWNSRYLMVCALTLLLVGEFSPASLDGAALPARHEDTEAELLARVEQEANPVKKAKYEIRLGSVKLQQAIDAYNHDQFEDGSKLLDACLKWMTDSWSLLKSTGRDASRKPQGFKDLDITLREDARLLEDLRHRVPYADRGPLDHIAQELDKTHSEVLAALFPGGQASH